MKIIALFNLKPGTAVGAYEEWARTVDLPTVNALPSIDRFEVFRATGQLGVEDPAPYSYVEIIDVNDMDQFGVDASTPEMQAVAGDFQRMADVTFIMTEKLEASK